MALPALSSLIAEYPDLEFWGHPRTSGLLPVFFPSSDVHTVKKLPFRKFDRLLLMTDSFRSAFYGFLSMIPERTGYTTDLRNLLLTRRIKPPHDRNHHHSLDYIALSDAAGARGRASVPAPYVKPSNEPHNAFFAGARYGSAKRWPRFTELAVMLYEETRLPSVFYGTPEEMTILNETASGVPFSSVKTDLDIPGLISDLLSARIVIGNDSGGVHISSIIGIPTVTIFGSTSPVWTAPLGEKTSFITSDRFCAPCFKRTCPGGNPDCLDDISADTVRSVSLELLETWKG